MSAHLTDEGTGFLKISAKVCRWRLFNANDDTIFRYRGKDYFLPIR
jgi:hypothetical protein